MSLNNEFSPYLEATWQKKSVSVANRGYTDDDDTVEAAVRKTAVQKCLILERMLGIVAQYSPSLLRNDIIKKSTNLAWIWKCIRRYYSFQQSEVNFLKLSSIRKQDGERFETLFQRIIAHLEDNLLTVESGLIHDGTEATEDEMMSPTTERLAVYLWLMLIDERLPSYISRVYAHDLGTKTIKELQPQIVNNMESLLQEINAQEDIQVQFSRSSHPRPRSFVSKHFNKTDQSKSGKTCFICKTAGRPFQGHDTSSCWYISKMDKLSLSKALKVDVDILSEKSSLNEMEDLEEHTCFQQNTYCQSEVTPSSSDLKTIQRVQCSASPSFYAFYEHHPCKCIIDTGATSSLISAALLQIANIKLKPTRHAARQVDRSSIALKGEIHITLSYGDLMLPIDALVVDALDRDILIGVPFCVENDVSVHLKQQSITIKGVDIPYGATSVKTHNIFQAESHILRNDSPKVIFPGEFLEIHSNTLNKYNGREVAIEPRIDSPLNGNWPYPSVSRVIQNTVRIPNRSNEPIRLSKLH